VQALGDDDAALAPVIQWRDEPDRGCSEVKVCTWDRAGLFGKIAGSLSCGGPDHPQRADFYTSR